MKMKSTLKNILTLLVFSLFLASCADTTKDSLTDPSLKKATGDKKAIDLAKKLHGLDN